MPSSNATLSQLIVRSTGEDHVSLEEVNGSVSVPKAGAGFWRTLLAYSGPGALVAVGYMDPGNWITSVGGGADYGYLLLSVILISSLIAMLLQYMAAKLGIVTGLDLAQATRKYTGRKLGIVLWIVAELAIMATDVAEVIGGAIALHLLFNLPIVVAVLITVFDVLLLLLLLRVGFRHIEAIIVSLIAVIMIVFVYEVAVSGPDLGSVVVGFVPRSEILHSGQLTMALGIVGATVMPHNLYLHSAISQTRNYDRKDPKELHNAVRFATIDSNMQLSVAFVINCLLLVLGAAMFFGHGDQLGTFNSLYSALDNPGIVGAVASPILATLFAVALLASGQNSTITGTLTGQIVMEGFINLKVPLWMRRIVTRLLAIIPVLICTILFGGNEHALDALLINSQVFLSLALPVSMIPLILLTTSKRVMGADFHNSWWVAGFGAISTVVLTYLNIQLLVQTVGSWIGLS